MTRPADKPSERIGRSKVKICVVLRRRDAGHVVGEDRAKARARFLKPPSVPLRSRPFALASQSIGKEADNIEENEFIGEDTGPPIGIGSLAAIALLAD